MPLQKPNCMPYTSNYVDEKSFPHFMPQFSPPMSLNMKNELSNLSTKSLDLSSNSSVDSDLEPLSHNSSHHHQFSSSRPSLADCDSIDLRIETKKNQDKPFAMFNSQSPPKSPEVDSEQRKLIIVENEDNCERHDSTVEGDSSMARSSPSLDKFSSLPSMYYRSASPDGDSSCSSNSEGSLNLTVAVGSEESDGLVLNRIAPSHTLVTIHHGGHHHTHHPSKAAALKDYSINSIMREQFGHQFESLSH